MKLLKNNLVKRTLVALTLGPAILFLLTASAENEIAKYASSIIVGIIFIIAFIEWAKITSSSSKKILWWLIGSIYILVPAYFCITVINNGSGEGPSVFALLVILLIVWATDIGGYAFGKLIGGAKLAPKISPNKTWAGVLGGVFMAITFVLLPMFMMLPQTSLGGYIIASIIIISIFAQLGDLFESWVKRKFKVKDSGSILPGHGGVLDRIDGLIPALWLFLFSEML